MDSRGGFCPLKRQLMMSCPMIAISSCSINGNGLNAPISSVVSLRFSIHQEGATGCTLRHRRLGRCSRHSQGNSSMTGDCPAAPDRPPTMILGRSQAVSALSVGRATLLLDASNTPLLTTRELSAYIGGPSKFFARAKDYIISCGIAVSLREILGERLRSLDLGNCFC